MQVRVEGSIRIGKMKITQFQNHFLVEELVRKDCGSLIWKVVDAVVDITRAISIAMGLL